MIASVQTAALSDADYYQFGSIFGGTSKVCILEAVPERQPFFHGRDNIYGNQPTSLRRDGKWLDMLAEWDATLEQNYGLIRKRCRKGIPMTVRPTAWFYLSGAKKLLEKFPQKYDECIAQKGDPKCLDEIRKDLHRQSTKFISEDKTGRENLFNVLKAYSIYNPSVGYSQGQAPIAAFLLIYMPPKESFWCLVTISDRYLKGYFSRGMVGFQRDALVLEALLQRVCPTAYTHLQNVNAEPTFYCAEWLLSAFTRTLPWDSLLRVWDIFICEGVKALFQTALVILIGCLGTEAKRERCKSLFETLAVLKNPPESILTEHYMMFAIRRLKLTDKDFQDEHLRQEAKFSTTI